MFETHIPISSPLWASDTDRLSDRIASDQNSQTSELRPIAWFELVAKLAATHDLRAAFAPRSPTAAASFGDGAASYLSGSAIHECDEIKAVNPNGLGHGKAQPGKDVAAAPIAVDGDRETL